MAKKIAIGVVVVLVLFLGFVAMQPTEWRLSRSTTIDAPPEAVYAVVGDLNQFVKWSPWNKYDPAAKQTVTGPAGVGQKYEWAGNEDVGRGQMTTTAATPGKQVVQDLEFIEPFASKAVVTFDLVPEGAGTKVSWGFDTKRDFMAKGFGLFVDMDKMLGDDFQRGLGELKKLAEEENAKRVAEAKQAAEAAAATVAATPPPAAAAAP